MKIIALFIILLLPTQNLTIETLSKSAFNKIRMCVFPKNYAWSKNDPEIFPYRGTAPKEWDFSTFNPAFFEKLEKRILQLQDLGIECDLILFHPYDQGRWGFDAMTDEQDKFYLWR